MDIRLIAADLDDTLMRPDKSISDYTADVLRRCRDVGVPVCLITARSLKTCERASRLTLPDYTVTCGGALCLCGDKVLLKAPLSGAETDEIIRFCMNLPSVMWIQTETADGDYLVSNEVSSNFTGDYAHASHYDFRNGLVRDVYKLVVRVEDENELRMLKESFPNARIYNYVGGKTCFIASNKATKLRGLKLVAAHMGVGLENVAAFGDDTGDVDYLTACGYGVAVDNALDDVKRFVRYTCGANSDDGVARWLEENVLMK